MPLKFLKKLVGDLHYAMNIREHAYVNYLLPEEKREYLERYSSRYKNFVETGTYLGETTAAMAEKYEKVYTVEIHEEMYENAVKRFSDKPSVKCFQGDSADRLAEIVNELEGPAVFWLDAHYSGTHTGRCNLYDTPIKRELDMIFASGSKEHLILIDDARLFVGRKSYPTIGALRKYVREETGYQLTIREDIIRLWHDPEWA